MKQLSRIAQSVLMLALAGTTVGFVGCAEDVGTLDRTRPDRVEKALFDNNDEWYFHQVVIDTDFQGSSIFQALQADAKRIRWTITEDTLFAHTTVEPAIGTSKGLEDKEDRRLGVVAAFPITSHFDVQRGYNSQTGQLSNVISENTTDRLWFDRKYMRVDWSRMTVDDIGLFNFLGRVSSVKRGISEVDKSADPNRTRIGKDSVETVTEFYVEPDIGSCFSQFGVASLDKCQSGSVKVRSYFMKVPKKQTYEPLPYEDVERFTDKDGRLLRVTRGMGRGYCKGDRPKSDGGGPVAVENAKYEECEPLTFDLFKRFGYFREESIAYDPSGAIHEEQRVYYAKRHNIWEDAYDEEGKSLPLSQRKPKQIVYYTNVGFPEERWYGVEKVAKQWNKVFTQTISLTRDYSSCDLAGVNNWYHKSLAALDRNYREKYLQTGSAPGDGERDIDTAFIKVVKEKADEKWGEMSDQDAQKFCKEEFRWPGALLTQEVVDLFANDPSSNLSQWVPSNRWLLNPELQDKQCELLSKDEIKDFIENYELVRNDVLTDLHGLDKLDTNWESTSPSPLPPKATYLSKDYIMASYLGLGLKRMQEEMSMAEISARGDGGKRQREYCEGLERKVKQESTPGLEGKIFGKGYNLYQFDFDNSKVKEIIAQSPSNQGCKTVEAQYDKDKPDLGIFESFKPALRDCSGDMFVIKLNSCSPKMLMEWKKEHGKYSDVFEGMDEKALQGLTPKKLERFCAKLEAATENDPDNRFDWQRQGDLHYNYFTWVYNETPWLGYGPVSSDPITGEIISGSANFAGKSLEAVAERSLRNIRLANGELSLSDHVVGDYLRKKYISLRKDAQKESGVGVRPGSRAARNAISQVGENEQNERRVEFRPSNLSTGAIDTKNNPVDFAELEKISKLQQRAAHKYRGALERQKNFAARMAKVLSSEDIRRELMSDPDTYMLVKGLASERFGKAEPTDDELDQAFNFMVNPLPAMEEARKYERRLAEQNIMSLDPVLRGMDMVATSVGAASFFSEKVCGPNNICKPKYSEEDIKSYLSNVSFYSTQLHEVGHTLGLRHNFGGSADALNYHPVYWELRGKLREHQNLLKENNNKEEAVKLLLKEKLAPGCDVKDVKVLKSSKDLGYLSRGEVKCLLEGKEIELPYFSEAEYRHAAIMDYTPGVTNGAIGLGSYENAAIQFAYGNKLEVFSDDVNFSSIEKFYIQFKGVNYEEIPGLFAYSQFGEKSYHILGYPATAEAYQRGVNRLLSSRSWVDVSELRKKMKDELAFQSKQEQHDIRDLRTRPGLFENSEKDLTVPYVFCSDELVAAREFCSRHDYGANRFEIVDYNFDTFRFLKNILRYRSGRDGSRFLSGYIGQLLRTMSLAQEPFYSYSLYKDFAPDEAVKDMKKAAAEGLNFMAEIYSQPELGTYCWNGDSSRYEKKRRDDCKSPVVIGRDVGGDYPIGVYSTEYESVIKDLGTRFDKRFAIQMMFSIQGNLGERLDLLGDLQASNVSYWTEFKQPIFDFVNGVMNDKPSSTGGVVREEDGKMIYEPLKLVDPSKSNFAEAVAKQKGRRVETVNSFNEQLYVIVASLLANDTFFDLQIDFSEYMKVCLSKTECNEQYSNATEFKVFEHPYTSQKYVAPIFSDINGKKQSITGEIIDSLNSISKLLKENVKKYEEAKMELDTIKAGANPDPTAIQAAEKKVADAKRSRDIVARFMEFQITKLDRIRHFTSRVKSL